MSRSIIVPEMGESVLEATVAKWVKKEGDTVSVGDVVVELETDKVNMEVGAHYSGVISSVEVNEGETVKVGDTLGSIDESGKKPDGQEDAASSRASKGNGQKQKAGEEKKEVRAPLDEQEIPEVEEEPAEEEEEEPETEPAVAQKRQGVSTPLARELAKKHGIELGNVKGTGSGGKRTKEDVERYVRKQGDGKAGDAALTPGRRGTERKEERKPMTRRRQTIARRLVDAQKTAAMLTTFNEVDMSIVIRLRAKHKASFGEKYGAGLGFLSFFVKASVAALKEFPELNAEIDGNEMVLKQYYDIGIAVGASDGLVVPVIREADKKSFGELEQSIKDLAERAESNQLSLEELRGGTFTITNGGVFGSLFSTPILNPPQVAILGLHAIGDRPVVVSGDVAIRPMMYVALTYDHRLVDGKDAVRFLVRIKELIEDDGALLLEG